jgi:hypothetical protein
MKRWTEMPLRRSLKRRSVDVDSYNDGAPRELFESIHGRNRCAKRNKTFHEPSLRVQDASSPPLEEREKTTAVYGCNARYWKVEAANQ